MNRAQAMAAIDRILDNYPYLYKKRVLNIHTLHLSFNMGSAIYMVQMSFDFQPEFVDILCFISPTVAAAREDRVYPEVLKTVNCINQYMKSLGRFYFDDCGDFAYSLRLDNTMLENAPDICADALECAMDCYTDIFDMVLAVLQGKASFGQAKEYIDGMWGEF